MDLEETTIPETVQEENLLSNEVAVVEKDDDESKDMLRITVCLREDFGRTRYYPVCRKSKALALIRNMEKNAPPNPTFKDCDLELLKKELGYKIKVLTWKKKKKKP